MQPSIGIFGTPEEQQRQWENACRGTRRAGAVAAPERLRSSMINGIKHWQIDYTGLNTPAATGNH